MPKPINSKSVADTAFTPFMNMDTLRPEAPPQPAPSVASSGSSERGADVVYPRPPSVPANSSYTECPFCSMEVAKRDIHNPKWLRYVFTTPRKLFCCLVSLTLLTR
jgi:hypothetical protein